MPADTAAADCHVCGNAITDANYATCNNCDRTYHLRQREDIEGIDCGEVWVNEQYLSLEFACHVCLGKRGESGSEEPPVGLGH